MQIAVDTTDAVRRYLWLFEEHNVLEFLILAGDQNFGFTSLSMHLLPLSFQMIYLGVDTANMNINFVTEMFTYGTLKHYGQKHKRVNIIVLKHWCRQILKAICFKVDLNLLLPWILIIFRDRED
ncbi:hypothetical protein ACSBR1_025793 [Camellia fascicularis]